MTTKSETAMSETDSTEMPAAVAACFEKNPRAHTVCVEMGHAWGRCKFQGTCRMTGLHMSIGSSYRHIEVWTRSGRHFKGTVAAKSAEFWGFVGGCDGSGITGWSAWRRWTPEWLTEFDLESLPVDTKISVAKTGMIEMDVKSWVKQPNGTWQGHGWSRSTSKQLRAAFARTTKAVAYKIEEPWSPTPATAPDPE